MKIYSKTIGYKGEKDDFVKLSELRELLEKKKKEARGGSMSPWYWNAYNSCLDELLAELDAPININSKSTLNQKLKEKKELKSELNKMNYQYFVKGKKFFEPRMKRSVS
jgi:hypothetical protein